MHLKTFPNFLIPWFLVGSALLTLPQISCLADGPALPGNLAFVKNGSICIGAASALDALITIPRSKGAVSFSESPRSGDGTFLFFAARVDKPSRGENDGPLELFISRTPYRESQPIRFFVGKDDDITITWTAEGDAEIGVGDLRTRHLDVKTGKLTVEPDSLSKSKRTRRPAEAGDVSATVDSDNRVLLSRLPGTAETVLFAPKSPDAMFAAIKRARNPANLKSLTDEVDPALWKDSRNWAVGSPALTPDQKSVFFAANLGTSMGAQGNTSFCLFTADSGNGRLAVLSKAGSFFGRVPYDLEVSPDGERLFFTTSVHTSAADNSFAGYVIDMQTQQTREIIRSDPAHASDSNLTAGWTWSPDGHYLALAIDYYNPAKLKGDSEPDLYESTLYIKDAATGRIIQQIQHARLPVWTR